jgi:hypothetical protein
MKHISLLLRITIIAFSFVLLLNTACKQKKKRIKMIPVSIKTTPNKVNVKIISHKNVNFGLTPCKHSLPPGSYIFKFSKQGYRTELKKITCSINQSVNLDFKMQQLNASVIIESEPNGASVLKEGTVIGQTPLLLKDLPLGVYSYILKKNSYSPRELKFSIEDERPFLAKVNLNSNIGILKVRSIPSGAKVFMNNTPRGLTPAVIKTEEGEYTVSIQKDGYDSYEQKVILSKGTTIKINSHLNIKLASMVISTDPSGAAISVNGRKYNDSPLTLNGMQPGTYIVEATMDHYDIAQREVSVAPGQNATVNLKLDSNMCGLDLVVNPPGVAVYIDGKKRGITKPGEVPNVSKIFEVRNSSSGKHFVLLAHKRAKPSQVKFSVNIQKGEIKRKGPIYMWIEDTYLKLKSGRELTGRINYQNKDEIIFELSPKIKVRYARNEISIMRKLTNKE